jgi:hypothetical protein
MLEKQLNHRNLYFDTYYIRDTSANKYIGIIEDHCRHVQNRYFIGWQFENNHFVPNTHGKGRSALFNTYEEALTYIQQQRRHPNEQTNL